MKECFNIRSGSTLPKWKLPFSNSKLIFMASHVKHCTCVACLLKKWRLYLGISQVLLYSKNKSGHIDLLHSLFCINLGKCTACYENVVDLSDLVWHVRMICQIWCGMFEWSVRFGVACTNDLSDLVWHVRMTSDLVWHVHTALCRWYPT